MRCKANLILFICSLLAIESMAQIEVKTCNAQQTLCYKVDERMAGLLQRKVEYNKLNQTTLGFRVQLYFGVNRPKASELRMLFQTKFPDISSYITYEAPYFKVRVGDFTTRLEATGCLNIVQKEFTNCFIVPDQVKTRLK
ncbi:MAG: hypothetical protein RIQ89_1932 [Bacteroidota bacterium]|jgi:hypothetical protein